MNRRSLLSCGLSYGLRGLLTAGALPLISLASGCGGGSGSSSTALGQLSPDLTRQIDRIVADQMTAMRLPGVALTVSIPSQGQYTSASGKANLQTGEARTADTPFRIASITKTFTATAVYLLADQGRLSVSDKLAKWYPDFPKADRITIDHLLRMRSGIVDSIDTAFLAEYFADPTLSLTIDDTIARAAAMSNGHSSDPDQATIYNNVNFQLLERIVERVSGQPLSQFLQGNILGPLGMTNTYYPTGNDLPGPNRGYSADLSGNITDKTILNPSQAGGAGAIISTLADLRIYARALGRGDLLRSATQTDRLRSQSFAGGPEYAQYGGGLLRLGKFLGHNGTIFGFSSEMWYLPEKDAVIVIDVNRLDADDASKSLDLFLRLSKLLFPEYTSW
ncbi:MAG: serine hydrolase domain-containing protein [Armatimonadota bacterium]